MDDDDDPKAGEATTVNYGWVKPTVGASDDLWGGYINADLDGIDSTVKSVSTSVPIASTTPPLMDGVAAVGTGAAWARADHVHPSDASRLALVGVTNGSDAAVGQIGEYIQADRIANVSFTTNVVKTIVSMSLTAGDWDVQGVAYAASSASVLSSILGSISLVANTMPDSTSWLGSFQSSSTPANQLLGGYAGSTGSTRVSISAPTTVYLVAQVIFASGTCSCQGSIRARRMR